MLGPLTLNILVPSLPGLVTALQAPKADVQLTLSLYLLGMAFSQLLLGPLADRYGRRPVLLVALALYVAASLAAFAAPTIGVLIVARIAQSFGATAGLTLARTMIRDLHERDSAASLIGYVTMAMVIAPMIAPTLGGAIDDVLGWRAILVFCAILGALSLAMAALRLPETRPAAMETATGAEVARRTFGLLTNRAYMGYWGASAFASGIFVAFLGAAPYLMIEGLGRAKTEYGLWFMSLSIGYMIGNYLSGRFSPRLGLDRLLVWGNYAGVVGAVAMLAAALALPMHPLTLFLPAMITSFGNGLVLPNAIGGGIGVDPRAAGAGSGLMGFGQMGIGAAVSFATAQFGATTALPLALAMLVCAVLAIGSTFFGRNGATSPR